ncbi:SRPBCC domain-containing protein, partial [Burkholderia pseudomallei]|uniref:SRPBCC domain-containing protein n=1 Tax=Burkholderia pseudomallei TaxID=28450 RepID=UPI0021F77BAC
FMRGPDGGTSDNPGCFLEIAPEAHIVFTSMLTGGWRPHTPWLGFTAIVTLNDDDAGCRYEARVMHPDAATRDRHEQLGLFEGWNICITQLDELAGTLR